MSTLTPQRKPSAFFLFSKHERSELCCGTTLFSSHFCCCELRAEREVFARVGAELGEVGPRPGEGRGAHNSTRKVCGKGARRAEAEPGACDACSIGIPLLVRCFKPCFLLIPRAPPLYGFTDFIREVRRIREARRSACCRVYVMTAD